MRTFRRSALTDAAFGTCLVAGLLFGAEARAQTAALQPGQAERGTVAAGDTVAFTFSAGEDWFVVGEVAQLSGDVAVDIVDEEGDLLLRVPGTERGSEHFSAVTTRGGTHSIRITPVAEEDADIAVTLRRAEPLETDPERLAEQLLSPYEGDDSPGAAVRVWRDGETVYSRTTGMANLAYGIPFEADTPTNIGSTSKHFTAFAVLLEAERGALSLDDDVRVHVPELPEFDHPITIRHLLTHTSGLREVYNLLLIEGRDLTRGDFVGREEVVRVVQRQPALQNIPGTEWNYNNTAWALAALIVERTSGLPFHDYMRENVFEPLGMRRTRVRPTADAIIAGRTQGYAPGGEGWVEVRDLGGAVGAGTVHSTIEDLERWVANLQNPTVGTRDMVSRMTTSYVLQNGDSTGYGLGLFVDRQGGLERVWHNGADIAHRSNLVWFPEIDAGLTTQSNHASFDSGHAYRLAAAFFADAMEEGAPAEGGGDAEDPAASDDPTDDEPAAPNDSPADDTGAWAPSPTDLAEFAGRYFADEIETFYDLTVEGDRLVARQLRLLEFTLTPTEEDAFSGGTAFFTFELDFAFERDRAGRILGFYAGNGRTRDVRFERIR